MEYKKFNVYAKCPFYERLKEKSVVCEGLIPGTVTEHPFENEAEKWVQFSRACCSDYKDCVHYKCLCKLYEERKDNG